LNRLGFPNKQILKQSIASFLAVTFLFISTSAQAEYEVKNSNFSKYFTSLEYNFSDTFHAVQPQLKVVKSGQYQLQLFPSVGKALGFAKALNNTYRNFLPQVSGIQIHLLTILELIICTNAP